MQLQCLNDLIENLGVEERLILDNVPENIYHESLGVGSTLLKAASHSMAHFHYEKTRERDFTSETLKTFAIGSLTHCLILEPHLLDEKFVLQPSEIKTRTGKKWEAFKSENTGREIITSQQYELAFAMAEQIKERASGFFINGEAEKSYWYRHANGLILKSRVDYQKGDAIIDIKTTKAKDPDAFKRAVKYDYNLQDALYRLTTGLADMIYIGVAKLPPHPVFLCKQGADVRNVAENTMHKLFEEIKIAEEMDIYPNIRCELTETELTPYETEKYL